MIFNWCLKRGNEVLSLSSGNVGCCHSKGQAPNLQSTGTNWALGMKHPTWRQVTQCWQGWTAQISLWLFPKEFTLFNSSRRKMPKGHGWKEFPLTLSHTHTHPDSLLWLIYSRFLGNKISFLHTGLPWAPSATYWQRPSSAAPEPLCFSISSFPLHFLLFINCPGDWMYIF